VSPALPDRTPVYCVGWRPDLIRARPAEWYIFAIYNTILFLRLAGASKTLLQARGGDFSGYGNGMVNARNRLCFARSVAGQNHLFRMALWFAEISMQGCVFAVGC